LLRDAVAMSKTSVEPAEFVGRKPDAPQKMALTFRPLAAEEIDLATPDPRDSIVDV